MENGAANSGVAELRPPKQLNHERREHNHGENGLKCACGAVGRTTDYMTTGLPDEVQRAESKRLGSVAKGANLAPGAVVSGPLARCRGIEELKRLVGHRQI